jgi:DNA-binding SARP family transcriptional activator
VRLLGGLVVEGLRPVDVGSRKARTVLAALALPPRSPVPVDVLAEALWGDDLPARPAEQVGVLISRLRGVLGADRLPRHDAGYSLVADWVDVDELEVRAGAAQAHLAAGDGLAARLAATMALDLATGPLLPEEDGEWVARPRAAVDRQVAAVGLVAAEAALLLGDPLGAAAAAAVALDHDPYDEAALRALMRAHVAAGRPASALAAYADMRARLSEDLGVSPDEATEAVHERILGTERGPRPPAPVDGWDPLVQRARVELASNDLAAARRDAEEAVRRGGGPGALELAGWVAYYCRDFPAALRWAEEAAARTEEDERRASCLTLAGRVRHSYGDLRGSEAQLVEATRSDVAGVKAMGEVWLGALRVHQGQPAAALELAARGAVDAAALRHPFVMSHAMFTRVYALAQQGRVTDLLADLDAWDRTLQDLGDVGTRYKPAAANFRAWVLAAIGRRAEAVACSERALEITGAFQEPRAHALLDLARVAAEDGDVADARRWLDQLEIPPNEAGTMAWHQRHREGLLDAQLALLDGDTARAEQAAQAVVVDAAERGARRAELLARAVVAEARARGGVPPAAEALRSLLDALTPVAGLERWRVTAHLAAATGWGWLREDAARAADQLAAACGPDAADVRAWIDGELARIAATTG